MAENKVSVEITMEQKAALRALSQLSREINKTEGDLEGLGKTGDSAMNILGKAGQGASDGFKSLVGGVTIANLASSAIIGVANEIKSFVVGSVNAAAEQENAINRLSQALKSAGSFSQAAIDDFSNFASELQQVSVYGDEVVISQLALAKSFGASNEQAKKMVQAAADLAATYGGSLESRVEQLGKTLTGTAGKLGTLIPGFKDLTEAQLRSGEASDFINSKIGGAAANELNTYAGQVVATKNAYSDLQEELGAFVTSSTSVSGVNTVLKGLFEEMTESLKDYRTEISRGSEGFKESQESVNQLSREYEEVTQKINDAKAVLAQDADPNTGFLQSLFLNTVRAKEQIQELSIVQKDLYAQITQAQVQASQADASRAQAGTPTEKAGISPEDQKRIDSRREAHAALIAAEAEFAAYENERRLEGVVITEENKAQELQALIDFEAEKINARYLAEEQKVAMIKDAETRQLAEAKIASKKRLDLQESERQAKKKIDDAEIIVAQQKKAALIGIMGSTFALGSAIAKEGSKEQFLIQKAAAAAQIVVATAQAMALAAATPPGLPATAPVVAYAKANGAIQLATVLASAIKGYEHGGVVPGASYTGDMVMARVNSGEAILNRSQQANTLMAIANGGGSVNNSEILERLISSINNQPINIVVDGRVLATTIRSQVQAGFRLS